MIKNHSNGGSEYKHQQKMIFILIYIFKFFTPTSASLAISTVCGGMLHTL